MVIGLEFEQPFEILDALPDADFLFISRLANPFLGPARKTDEFLGAFTGFTLPFDALFAILYA